MVVTDVNPYRLELATKLGATHVVDVRSETHAAGAQKRLGMKEGFRRRPGNERQRRTAFRDLLANMAHGGRIAMLGIPEKETAIDWNTRHLQHAHHQGHLRPGDVRNLVQNDGDAAKRIEAGTRHHAPLRALKISKKASTPC